MVAGVNSKRSSGEVKMKLLKIPLQGVALCFLLVFTGVLLATSASAGVLIVGGNFDDDPADPFGASISSQGRATY